MRERERERKREKNYQPLLEDDEDLPALYVSDLHIIEGRIHA